MEYRPSGASAWTDISGTSVSSLAPAAYQVRLKATASAFAGAAANVTIAAVAPTRVLTVTAPAFTAESYGYAGRPAAQSIIIANSGNSAATISGVTVSPAAAFDIAGSGTTVAAGGQITTWTVQPKAGLGAGTYTATITVAYNGTGGTTATAGVGFTVNPPVNAQAPVISSHPQDRTVTVGGSVTLSVSAGVSDGGVLSYQWYRNTTNSTSGGAVVGGNSNSYSPPTSSAGTLYYYVTVTNTNAGASGTQTAATTSNAASVTAIQVVNAEAPYISSHPQDITVTVGDDAALSVAAGVSDGGVLSYQWYLNTTNSTSGGTPISGATDSRYSPSTSSAGTAYYYVEVTNTNSRVNGSTTAVTTSNAASVTATPPAYAVTVVSTGNGTVTASHTSAQAGVTVLLTLAPAAGYEPDAVTAYRTGATGTPVALSGSGNARAFTMPEYGVTVAATFKKTQAQVDRETVDETKVAIQNGTYRVAQATSNDAAGIKTWLLNTLNILSSASHSVQFRSAEAPVVGDVEITAFIPATQGTESAPNGVNGSFTFSVSLTRGAATATATFTDGVIIATPHASTPLKRIEVLYLGNLNVRILNTGNRETGNLTLALSGAHADAFTVETQNFASLSVGDEADITLTRRADLPAGTYTATLTVSGDGLTEAVAFTYAVTPTGAESPQPLKQLKAWTENGRLHVSGLTAGKPWFVYSISGALIYQNIATGDEADIYLSVHGAYIITSDGAAVKAIY